MKREGPSIAASFDKVDAALLRNRSLRHYLLSAEYISNKFSKVQFANIAGERRKLIPKLGSNKALIRFNKLAPAIFQALLIREALWKVVHLGGFPPS